jgi:hypothetical protein
VSVAIFCSARRETVFNAVYEKAAKYGEEDELIKKDQKSKKCREKRKNIMGLRV